MRMLALLLAVPLSVLAQPTTPSFAPPEPRSTASSEPSNWSLGVGWSPGYLTYSGTTWASWRGPGSEFSLGSPPSSVSLERRLTPRTWAVVGLYGAFHRERQDPSDWGMVATEGNAREFDVAVGLRHVLTRPGAPVCFSMLLLAHAGGGRAETRWEEPGFADTFVTETLWTAKGTAEIALDRELTTGLTLRIASPVFSADYVRLENETTDVPVRRENHLGASLLLSPRVELRLAF